MADGEAGGPHHLGHLGPGVAVAPVQFGLKLGHPLAQPGQLGVDGIGRAHVLTGTNRQMMRLAVKHT